MDESYILFDIPEGSDVVDREFLEQLGTRSWCATAPDLTRSARSSRARVASWPTALTELCSSLISTRTNIEISLLNTKTPCVVISPSGWRFGQVRRRNMLIWSAD